MSARLHESSDVPNFDAYQVEPPLPEKGPGIEGNSVLEERARQVGAAMGRLVAALERKGHKLQGLAAETKQAAVTQIDAARARARQASAEISRKYSRARMQTNQAIHDYPLHVVVIAGAVGFLLGAGLRLWRAKHE